MNKTVIEVQVRAVLPTSGGCAVFLGNNDKVFIIYVDQTVGSAITMFMRADHQGAAADSRSDGAFDDRPRRKSGASHHQRSEKRDLLRADDHSSRKTNCSRKKSSNWMARPSDCIAMATQQKAPIYVSQDVWDEVDDMSDVLRKMEEEGLKPDPETEE